MLRFINNLVLQLVGLHKLASICDIDSFYNLFIRGLRVSIEDILADRVIEESWLLHYEADSFSELADVVFAYVDAIDEHRSELRIVEPHDQANES
jgi:hypothetical protein